MYRLCKSKKNNPMKAALFNGTIVMQLGYLNHIIYKLHVSVSVHLYLPHSFFVRNNLSVTCPLLWIESQNLFHKNEFWWNTVAVLPLKHQAHLFFPAHNTTIVFAHFWNHEWTIFQKQYTTAQCTLLSCCTQSTTFITRIVSAKTA